jgi:hypothetical protein
MMLLSSPSSTKTSRFNCEGRRKIIRLLQKRESKNIVPPSLQHLMLTGVSRQIKDVYFYTPNAEKRIQYCNLWDILMWLRPFGMLWIQRRTHYTFSTHKNHWRSTLTIVKKKQQNLIYLSVEVIIVSLFSGRNFDKH